MKQMKSYKEYHKKYYERMKKDPIAMEARRKKDRERKKRQALLDKIQRSKEFLEEQGFKVTMK